MATRSLAGAAPAAASSSAGLNEYIAKLQHACRSKPDSADLHTCLGVAYASRKQFQRAKTAYEQAIEADPKHFFAHARYAELLLARGFVRLAEQRARIAEATARTRQELAMARRLLENASQARSEQPRNGSNDSHRKRS